MNNVINSGLALQQQAQGRATEAAGTLARGQVEVQPLVELQLAEQESAAAARLLQSADDMLGTLIDIRA
ncbi:hypothetical protein [Gallaecimonas sp. GXIMD4217]|uniref:hypothetical protein n=1 Tax=Gallaecimonas sp. GXIMD4217 TaxID=3131927 RepID=UPI00311ADE5F